MHFLAWVRNNAFWTLDTLKGNKVRKAYEEIKKIDYMDSNNPYIEQHQKKAWAVLKEKACTTTMAYKDYRSLDLSQFPVVTKQDIRARQDDFMSCLYNRDGLVQMSTSGSTGTPFICYQNEGKKRHVNAEIIYYSEKVGYHLGENLSYMRTVVKQLSKSKLKQFMQNQTLLHCNLLNDEGIEKLLSTIREQSEKGPVTLLGYSSTYTAMKDYFQKKNIEILPDCNVTGLISGSDMLFDETREVVRKVFGNIPMVSRYSNEENGVLGQDEEYNNVFAINEADYIIEILDMEGDQLPEGKLGRIVVTDLYNYAMPMIRYDTGDMGAIQTYEVNGRKKRCICQFSGRRVDVLYDTKGNALSPHVVTNTMWEFTDITQFQLIQRSQFDFTLKLNVDSKFDRETDVISALKEQFGDDARFDVERVNEIPVLSSGKRRYLINEYTK
jgi:phenylacetate-CoA ligase